MNENQTENQEYQPSWNAKKGAVLGFAIGAGATALANLAPEGREAFSNPASYVALPAIFTAIGTTVCYFVGRGQRLAHRVMKN